MHRYVQNRVLVYLKMLLVLTDALCLNIVFVTAFWLVTTAGWVNAQEVITSNYYSLWTTFNLVAIGPSLYFRLYENNTIERLENVFRQTYRTVLTLLVAFAVCVLIGHHFAGVWYFLGAIVLLLTVYVGLSRFALTYVYTVLPKRFRWSKSIALIGHNDYLAAVQGSFGQDHAFYHVNTIKYYDEVEQRTKEEKVAQFRRYFEEVTKLGIHDVFLVSTPDINTYSKELIMEANHQCVQLNFVPAVTATLSYGMTKSEAVSVDLPVIRSHEDSLSTMENRIKKRIVDLLISGFVLVFILSWMVPLIGLIIKLQSPGPIFFKQPRSGRNNQTFGCYKFRSMVVNKDSNKAQATKDDKRITPIGKFLRKTNLDEFPQFINVFLGQMTVVGPRPHMLSHTEHYSKLIQHYMVRHFVKPGITGWAQVNGYRGETKDPKLMAKRVEYDLEYITNWSSMLDFKIVFMTALNMLRGEKNAY
ncbi:exopolysaccharide biosynthesis polyprenyl glycosylphosphotransferase [Sphingobacterium corticibacterium]|uniref:Exopolysaccharide biosynthesis polyprenyl glycosylphosphotransferase n=1 Tax=Sphingobacterium corticibacterium TaxID=2484746 RepID=A0A4Q6XHC1_9SPHI|nr:exopolysaccharide biosynthesis polyprenyl glycosylphosphotransferase [Sphingobacterium corticibacterium]RZF58953.1 exopolysaccharide biosynthesis polyprenyl glycosylphosphotransferase [Sphingobacterium corticibacterium]